MWPNLYNTIKTSTDRKVFFMLTVHLKRHMVLYVPKPENYLPEFILTNTKVHMKRGFDLFQV